MEAKNQIKITKKDLTKILGEGWEKFEAKIIPNCFCNRCWDGKKTVAVVDYKVFLNHLDDVILRGSCAECGKRVNRYVETGEVDKYAPRIKQVRENSEKVGFEV